MEVSIDELINNIFNKQPQPEKTIRLEFVENLGLEELFEFLITFFTEGAKYKFGDINNNMRIDINKWTNYELDLMKNYFKSICFQINLKFIPITNENRYINYNKFNYKNIKINNNTKLNELNMAFTTINNFIIISFDYFL